MIKAILSDFSRVLLFPLDVSYTWSLNSLHRELLKNGDYDFWQHFKINDELLAFYQEYQNSIEVAILTEGHIQDYPPVKERLVGIFKHIFSAADLGLRKDNPQIYTLVAAKLEIIQNQIIYIDDKQKNIDAASRAGMNAFLYTKNDELLVNLDGIGGRL